MSEQKLKQGQKVFFTNEKLPYEVKAVSDKYAVVTRKLHRREDADLLHHQVNMSAYCSFTEAYDANKDNPVYSLLDFKQNLKAPDNLVLGNFDYFKKEDCENAIKYLEEGKMELSHRNRIELSIDWERTIASPQNKKPVLQEETVETIKWKDIKKFANSLTDEQLEKNAFVLISDESEGKGIKDAAFIENDIYVNNDDSEDCGRLEDLKELHGEHFDLSAFTLSTRAGTPFLWAE